MSYLYKGWLPDCPRDIYRVRALRIWHKGEFSRPRSSRNIQGQNPILVIQPDVFRMMLGKTINLAERWKESLKIPESTDLLELRRKRCYPETRVRELRTPEMCIHSSSDQEAFHLRYDAL